MAELPVYQIRGQRYYRDTRLGEYRNVNNPHDRIPIDDVSLADLETPEENKMHKSIEQEHFREDGFIKGNSINKSTKEDEVSRRHFQGRKYDDLNSEEQAKFDRIMGEELAQEKSIDKEANKMGKACKIRIKEDEDDIKRKATKEDEDEEIEKKPVKMVDGKMIKEDEDEAGKKKMRKEEEEEDEDAVEEKILKEDEDDDEEEDEEEEESTEKKKKKKTRKGELGGEDPEEQSETAASGSPKVPSKVTTDTSNNTGVTGERTATGKPTPSETTYKSTELMKSPLFVELDKQLKSMTKSFEQRLDDMEKSIKTRMVNLQKTVSKVEEFYNKPFYKDVDSSAPGTDNTISKKIKDGTVRYVE